VLLLLLLLLEGSVEDGGAESELLRGDDLDAEACCGMSLHSCSCVDSGIHASSSPSSRWEGLVVAPADGSVVMVSVFVVCFVLF
jgi:hypothetical protein